VFARLIQGFATGLGTTSLGLPCSTSTGREGADQRSRDDSRHGVRGSGFPAFWRNTRLRHSISAMSCCSRSSSSGAPDGGTPLNDHYAIAPTMVLQASVAVPARARGRIPRHDPDQCSALGPIGFLPGADAVPARDDNRPCRRLVGRARGRRVDGRRRAAILVLRRYSASSALILGAGALVAGLLGVLAGANVASLSCCWQVRARWHRFGRCLSRRAGQHRALASRMSAAP